MGHSVSCRTHVLNVQHPDPLALYALVPLLLPLDLILVAPKNC